MDILGEAIEFMKDGRAFRVNKQEDFLAFANENALFYPGFVIQNQQDSRFSQRAVFIISSDGRATYLEHFSTVLQAPDFNFVQYPFDTQFFFCGAD